MRLIALLGMLSISPVRRQSTRRGSTCTPRTRPRCGTVRQPQRKVQLSRRCVITEFIDIPHDVRKGGRLMGFQRHYSFGDYAGRVHRRETCPLVLPIIA